MGFGSERRRAAIEYRVDMAMAARRIFGGVRLRVAGLMMDGWRVSDIARVVGRDGIDTRVIQSEVLEGLGRAAIELGLWPVSDYMRRSRGCASGASAGPARGGVGRVGGHQGCLTAGGFPLPGGRGANPRPGVLNS